MKTLSTFLLAAVLTAVPTSCKSSQPQIPCRCGTPMADLEGCQHPSCQRGTLNPDNPNCVCGKLDIPSGKKE